MTYEWDNKKPTAQMLGRWQPFHEGHYTLFKEIIYHSFSKRFLFRFFYSQVIHDCFLQESGRKSRLDVIGQPHFNGDMLSASENGGSSQLSEF